MRLRDRHIQTRPLQRGVSPHIAIDVHLHDALGQQDHDTLDYTWEKCSITDITGEGVFFARSKQKVYVATGKVEMDIQVIKYRIQIHHDRHRPPSHIPESIFGYRIAFDADGRGSYRFRMHKDTHELELLYEHGEAYKIYSGSHG